MLHVCSVSSCCVQTSREETCHFISELCLVELFLHVKQFNALVLNQQTAELLCGHLSKHLSLIPQDSNMTLMLSQSQDTAI